MTLSGAFPPSSTSYTFYKLHNPPATSVLTLNCTHLCMLDVSGTSATSIHHTNSHKHITSRAPGGYTPRSSLPSFIRRTLIFSLMLVSCKSDQKQSSAGAITTSRGIPQYRHTHTDGNVLIVLPLGMERVAPRAHKKSRGTKQKRSPQGGGADSGERTIPSRQKIPLVVHSW